MKNIKSPEFADSVETEVCGGTSFSYDPSAPTDIKSDKMTFFSVESALGFVHENENDPLTFVSAFAAPKGEGSFLFLETVHGHRGPALRAYACVKENVFPELLKLARDCRLAADNGRHSETHGLPENFGGRIDIRYESGERISVSDNQSPVVDYGTACLIERVFSAAMRGEPADVPGVPDISAIRFREDFRSGGHREADLKIGPDGGKLKSLAEYPPSVYRSEKQIPPETVAEILETVEKSGLLCWADLPYDGYGFGSNESLTFVFREGSGLSEITVKNDRLVPDGLRRGFHDITLKLN